MTDLFDPKHDRGTACTDAARMLLPLLGGQTKLSRRDLNEAMVHAFGGSDAEGRWTQRESFEVLEHALALHLVSGSQPLQTAADLPLALGLLDRLPTQTVRSEEQIDWQQFSTPVDIAAVAVLLAAARPTDVVLEPSAGNGLLVAQLSTIAALQLNEIDPARRARLSATFPHAVVSGHDGATIGSTLTALQRPSLILMNPPFSRSVGRGADALAAVRHLQAALKRLRPGGRLVAIMPDWFAHSARMADIWTTTLAGTALRTSIRLTNGYGKHGTGVAVRIYVIDKIVGDIAGVTIARGNVAELVDLLVIPDRAALDRKSVV